MKAFLKYFGFVFLTLICPLFFFWVRKKQAFFDSILLDYQKDPYTSGMVQKFNIWHEGIFKPNFEKVRVDPIEVTRIQELTQQGTLVYVMKNHGQLEYSFFNHRFLKDNIPLAFFANGARTIYWNPVKKIICIFLARLYYYYQKGSLPDPIASGYLRDLVTSGQSALLNLKVSRELIFGTQEDPLEFIVPLIEASQKSPKPIYLITQQFLYDSHPEKVQKSWIDFLFGEKSNPGKLRKLILFFLSYRKRATVKFGEAFDLNHFINENKNLETSELARQLNNILITRLRIERKSITGPVLRPRERFLDGILRNKNFKEEIERLRLELGKSHKEIQKQVTKYFKEIAASVNYTYVDLYDRLIHWLVHRVHDGIDLDTKGLSQIKKIAGKYPIVLVPCHKSHVDYLILSYIFYNHDLTLPHVCAGINLNFWPASPLIRRGGGFFIRRSFRGNDLYKTVLEHYVKQLVRDGYSIEFFIEGTRSRTGRLLKPRMGFLSLLIKAYLDGAAPDLYFVPLSINYENILEEKSYAKELKGSTKQKENLIGLVQARKTFGRKYGKIFVRFSDPISLKEYCEEKGMIPGVTNIDDSRRSIDEFARKMTYFINRVSVVTPTSVVAMVLLSYPKKGIPESEIIRLSKVLQHYLEYKGAHLSDLIRQKPQWAYKEALQKFASQKLVTAYRDFSEKFYTLEEVRRGSLDYHKNNSIHFFVSLICFSKILKTMEKQELTLEELKIRYESFKTLLRHDFTFSVRASLTEHLMPLIEFYVEEGMIDYDPTAQVLQLRNNFQTANFKLYESLLDNLFEASYVVLVYLKHISFEKMDSKKLLIDILSKGRLFYLKGELKYSEALTQFNLQNALLVYEDLGFVKKDEKNLLTRNFDEGLMNQWEEKLRDILGLKKNQKETSFLLSAGSEEDRPALESSQKELH